MFCTITNLYFCLSLLKGLSLFNFHVYFFFFLRFYHPEHILLIYRPICFIWLSTTLCRIVLICQLEMSMILISFRITKRCPKPIPLARFINFLLIYTYLKFLFTFYFISSEKNICSS